MKPLKPNERKSLVDSAVAVFWHTRSHQSKRQATGRSPDKGSRSAVTGGKHMDGFVALVHALLLRQGILDSEILTGQRLELPGYFRPEKRWDLIVIRNGQLLAAMEFKSQVGPSFGNNFNN